MDHGGAVRQRILEEAEHLIHLQGFRGTSLDEIARRCRMTKANLFHHFRSKEELGLAVLDFKAECYRRNCLDRVFAAGRSPEDAITELFADAACFFKGNGCKAGCFVGNIALEMSDVNPRFRERAGRFFEEWTAALRRLLEAAGVDGGAAQAAEAVLELYEGALMLARTRRDPSVFDRAKDAALRLVLAHAPAASGRRQKLEYRR
ncbi:MAG: TetR/AcrR family transcriptional regulator [Elusimicrobia bacterium]|nr:TetR/AcrR family transcriptional regulator [Elusimicrobiota bacterium]